VVDSFVICHDHDIEMKNPVVSFDGTDFVVLWQDNRNEDWDIYGAKVNSAGVVIDSFEVMVLSGDQTLPALGKGVFDQSLLSFSGPAPEPYNTTRIWGAIYPILGIEETAHWAAIVQDVVLFAAPNPFKEMTTLKFQIPRAKSQIALRIYNSLGRLIKDFPLPTAYSLLPTEVSWSGVDNTGKKLPAGVYFMRLEADEFDAIEKVILLR
jgi:hypothetical protein